ncbi:hypothetical protein AX15_000710 [Amanita polypyramis BW_CC]|nr:hypothetical protein AX15_000710 [Amanita polypyramis BW_CC]
MLASKRDTSRPRPPAKARRSASNSKALRPSASSPPPSYTDSFGATVGIGLPHSTTEDGLASPTARIRRENEMDCNDPWGLRGGDDESGYRGCEEDGETVSEMFDRANGVFVENDEVDEMSAVLGSSLEESGAFGTMRQPVDVISPLPTMPPLLSTPSRGYYTYSHSTPERLSDLSKPFRRGGHAQRVSMSAADVAYLADQNAELMEKLEKLEQESSHADLSGRRQLKRLEKEVAELREELEKTQARGEELEEKTKRGWNSEQVINAVARKKLEREAKMRALRNLGQGSGPAEETEVKSFAPEGSTFGGPSPGYSFMTPYGKSNSSIVFPKSEDIDARSVSSPFPSKVAFPSQESPTSETMSTPADRPEVVLINKLMEKMTELQEANTRIMEQQAETTKQLQAFQKETEQMNRIYQSMDSSFEIEDASDSDYDRTGLTRFHSFSQIVESRPPRSASLKKKQGSMRHRRRTLGSVDERTAKAASRRANASTSRLNVPIPFPPSPTMDRHHSFHELHDAFLSPALSLLSLDSAEDEFKQSSPVLLTLQSELGNALNAEGSDENNFHLRSTSIFNLSAKPSTISILSSPSPSPGHLRAYQNSLSEGQDIDGVQGPPTPMSLAPRGNSLLLHPEGTVDLPPATPAMDNRPTLDFTSPGLQSPRYYRMSQTVRSRTDRWVKGRFGNSLLGSLDAIEEPEPAPPVPLGVSQRLAHAFESVVEGFTSSTPEIAVTCAEDSHSSASSSRRSSVYEDATLAIESPVQELSKVTATQEKLGISKVVLELWLWLQFVVVILVFLWAMARRGPKAVLFEGNAVDNKRGLPTRR